MADNVLYIDCFSGISGDMFTAALLDLGLGSIELLQKTLSGLPLAGWSIDAQKIEINGLVATRFNVEVDEDEGKTRRLDDIQALINAGNLDDNVRLHALEIFNEMAMAEAKAHGKTPEDVHFHEVGMVDSIIDIVCGCLLIMNSGADAIHCSPVTLGSGQVKTRHGMMPVPVPAVANLLAGVPVRQGSEKKEMTTPTGAALAAHFTSRFGAMPDMRLLASGYGAGRHETVAPDVLRVIMGERLEIADDHLSDEQVIILETNIDDSTPEMNAYLVEKLLAEGAADVWLTPVVMKKGRAAVMLSVICAAADVDRLLDIVFEESTTFGVRIGGMQRRCLERHEETVRTSYGPVSVKIGKWRGREITISPEYEDCRKAAEKNEVPISEIYRVATLAHSIKKGDVK